MPMNINLNVNAITRAVLTVAGTALAGPVGTLIGGFLGGLTGSALPFATDLVKSLSTVAARESLTSVTKKTVNQLPPNEKERLNYDLQTAFRDALIEGLHDIGGAVCFPQVWRSHPRQVPDEVFYPGCHPAKKERIAGNLLMGQVVECLRAMEKAVTMQEILPLEPPGDMESSKAQTYLLAENPSKLNSLFFEENITPFLSQYKSLLNEAIDLEPHLRLRLLDRTLLHLGELLKKRTDAWCSFNRLSLESLRAVVGEVSAGQNALMARLDELVAQPQGPALVAWSDSMADLLSATGQIEKKLDEGFDGLTERVIAQHREVLSRLDTLAAGTARIESKVDRMLRFLDNGGYVIEGQMTVPMRKPPAEGVAPFKGLEYFSESDSDLFYGRDRLIGVLAERLGQFPFLAVVGASGSGKSSLVRAGLVPVLQGKRTLSSSPLLPVGCMDWPVHILTPTDQPFLSLAASLAPEGAALGAVRKLADELRADPAALDLAARRILAKNRSAKRLLLVVDQFEEVFSLCQDGEERCKFVEALLHAGGPHGRGSLVLVIIFRADFYADCAQYEDLREAISAYQEYIGPMNREELRQAIEEPAQRNGWKFEPGIVDLLIRDAGEEPGALPLLSHALLETWKNRSGHTMTLESYAESGGVRRAIAKTAESLYKRLTPEEAQTARSMLLRMIQPGENGQDTRRRVSLDELRPQSGKAAQADLVLRRLTEARLVTVDEGYAQVAHEALIREWPTLRQWLDEDRQGLRIQRKTTEAAQEWVQMERDEGLLFRGARLAEIQEWAAGHADLLNPLEREFIDRSAALAQREADEREAQRQRELAAAQRLAEAERERAEVQSRLAGRLRRGAIGLAAALLVAAAFAVISLIFANQAQHNAQQARAGQLAAQVLNLADQYPQRALLLGLEAVRIGKDNTSALDALYESLTRNRALPLIQIDGQFETATLAPWTDHPWAAAGTNQGMIYLWDLSAAELQPATLVVGTDSVYGLAFSPASSQQGFNKWLAASDANGRLLVWDVKDLSAPPRILQESGSTVVLALAFSPLEAEAGYGSWLVASNASGEVQAWDTSHWEAAPRLLVQQDQPIASLSLSADGKSLATGDWVGGVRLYDLSKGTAPFSSQHEYVKHSREVFAVTLSVDGKWLASGSIDNLVVLWNLKDPAAEPTVLSGYHDQVYALAFSPDSQWLAIGSEGDNLRLWNVFQPSAPLISLRGHENTVYGVSFSRDGRWLFSAGADGSARLWPSPVAKQTVLIPKMLGGVDFPVILRDQTDWVLASVYSPDGHWLASAGAGNQIILRDPQKLDQAPIKLPGNGSLIFSLAFSPDSRWLAVGDAGGSISIWDMNDQTLSRNLAGHSDWVQKIVFSPDGKWLASSSMDGTIRVWNMQDLNADPQVISANSDVISLAFSPDSQLLAAGADMEVWIFQMRDLAQAPLKLQGHTNFISSVVFSPDGKTLASGAWDNMVFLWNTENWQAAPVVLQGHQDRINGLAFSPDGVWLASASADRTARLWSLSHLDAAPLVLGGYEDEAQSLDFSPDGEWLAVGSMDGTVRLWMMDVKEIEALACRKVGRNLTAAEWKLYFPDDAYRTTCPSNP